MTTELTAASTQICITHLTQLVFINNAAFPSGDADVPPSCPMGDPIMKMREIFREHQKLL